MSIVDLTTFLLTLIASGGVAEVVSGWVSAHWTNASGTLMNVQTFIVGIVLMFVASFFGVIAIPATDVWGWLLAGVGNGTIASILYKWGVFNNLLTTLKARSNHQLAQVK